MNTQTNSTAAATYVPRNDLGREPEAEFVTTFDAVHAAILANNGMIHDDHHNGYPEGPMRKVVAIGKFGKHTVFLCGDDVQHFCLNGMYVDHKGIAHLSRWSVGGIVEPKRYGGLKNAVEQHNNPANYIPGARITEITDVVYF